MKKSLLLLTCALVASQAFAGGPLRADTDQHNFRPSTNVSFSETTLPIVYITVDGQIIQRESRVLATMKIIDNGDGHNYTDLTAHPSQKVDWEGPVALKYRGNTSFTGSDKKPFSLKTLSAADLKAKKAKVSIMGMGKDNDWALLAPWEDKTSSLFLRQRIMLRHRAVSTLASLRSTTKTRLRATTNSSTSLSTSSTRRTP